jgi:Protein of unknown function (DUF4197)
MKRISILLLLLPFFLLTGMSGCENTQLTDEQIAEGLKEALRVGTANSVDSASGVDGYFADSRIKIPWPQDAQVIETTLRGIGLNGLCDDLILKLNRAAENAATQAEPIFLDAVTNITIDDAVGILHGTDDAASLYLKDNTYDALKTAFKPDIEASLNSVGAQDAWTVIVNNYNSIPFVTPANSDLAEVVTGKALDGLFILLADEELKIRTEVSARVNDILRDVFGQLDN